MAITSPTIPLGTGIKVMTLVVQTNNNSIATYLLPSTSTTGSTTFGNMRVLKEIRNFFGDLVRGVWRSNTTVIHGGVYATIGATFASVVNTNTLVIGGVTITATSGTPTSVQFKVGGTDTVTAANAAATINALTTLNKMVFATSAGAVLTINSLFPGTIGNMITTTATGGTITVAATLAGGTDGTIGFISHGL